LSTSSQEGGGGGGGGIILRLGNAGHDKRARRRGGHIPALIRI